MMRLTLLFLPISLVVASPRPSDADLISGDLFADEDAKQYNFLSDPVLRTFFPDDDGNIIIPDDPKGFFDETKINDNFSPGPSWPETSADLSISSDNPDTPDDVSLIENPAAGLSLFPFPFPVYPYQTVNYCRDGFTLCSSGSPGDVVAIATAAGGEVSYAIRNGEQSELKFQAAVE